VFWGVGLLGEEGLLVGIDVLWGVGLLRRRGLFGQVGILRRVDVLWRHDVFCGVGPLWRGGLLWRIDVLRRVVLPWEVLPGIEVISRPIDLKILWRWDRRAGPEDVVVVDCIPKARCKPVLWFPRRQPSVSKTC